MSKLNWIMAFIIACFLAIAVNYMIIDLGRELLFLKDVGSII